MKNYTDTHTVYSRRLKTVTLRVDRRKRSATFSYTVRCPDDVEGILQHIYSKLDEDQEHLVLLTLTCGNSITGYKVISSGSQDGSLVDCKVIFRSALLLGARSIILAHNHPSEQLIASREDKQITRMVARAGYLMQIPLLDHFICTRHHVLSLKELDERLFDPSNDLING